jgi:hypothetical protein
MGEWRDIQGELKKKVFGQSLEISKGCQIRIHFEETSCASSRRASTKMSQSSFSTNLTRNRPFRVRVGMYPSKKTYCSKRFISTCLSFVRLSQLRSRRLCVMKAVQSGRCCFVPRRGLTSRRMARVYLSWNTRRACRKPGG